MKHSYFILFFILFLNFCDAQPITGSVFLTAEIILHDTQVFNNGGQWAFADKVYSGLPLANDRYDVNGKVGEWEILPDITYEAKLKNQYYLCSVYEFKPLEGFVMTGRTLSRSIDFPLPWKPAVFAHFESNMPGKVFNCESVDLVPEKIIYTTDISGLRIAVEDIGDNIYVALFNKKCMLFNILETPKEIFSYYETGDYFIVKSDKLFLLFAPGEGIGD